MDLSYILNTLGENREEYFNSMSPPIFQTSNFAFKTVADLRIAMENEMQAYLYTRGNNPTVEIVRKKIAALENTEDALLFSSGVAAICAAVFNTVKQGDHIICVKSTYSWTVFLLKQILPKYGVRTTFIDGREIKNFETAIEKNTKLIYLESPNTFLFELQDIEAVSKLAREKNITTIIDNSYCGPLFQQPFNLGVDVIVHTATKYLAGHSDVLAGVVCGTKHKIESIFKNECMCFGAVTSPHDAWLLLRGLRTLHIRMERSAATSEKIISGLEHHPKIEKIIYPFHKSHPQYELAKKQMKRGSGQFSILLKTKENKAIELFCNALQRFLLAVSWGGYESLIFPACIKENSEYPVNLIRFYTGLEDADILAADIKQALEKI